MTAHTRRQQQGAATLLLVIGLVLLATLASAWSSRAVLMDLLTSQTRHTGLQAAAAGQAALASAQADVLQAFEPSVPQDLFGNADQEAPGDLSVEDYLALTDEEIAAGNNGVYRVRSDGRMYSGNEKPRVPQLTPEFWQRFSGQHCPFGIAATLVKTAAATAIASGRRILAAVRPLSGLSAISPHLIIAADRPPDDLNAVADRTRPGRATRREPTRSGRCPGRRRPRRRGG